MNRTDILKRANECVTGSRAQDYGEAENNFSLIAALWEPYLKARCLSGDYDICICPEDVAVMMSMLKIARIATGRQTEDSFVDACGYLACAGEIATRPYKDPILDFEEDTNEP